MRRGHISISFLAILAALVAATPAGAASVFGLVDTGEFFVSSDAGANWTLRATLTVYDAVGVVARNSATELYMATRSGTVYRTTDAGVNWSAVGAVPASDVVGIFALPDGNLLLLAETGTVWRSTDGGANFSALGAIVASDLVSLTRSASGSLFALSQTGEVSRSTDSGANWTTVGAITTSDAVEIVAVADTLHALTDAGDIWRSTSAGTSWTPVATLSQVGMSGLVRDLSGTLYAVVKEGEVARSTNGISWSWVGAINQLNVMALATDALATSVGELPGTSLAFAAGAPAPNPRRGDAALTTFPFTLAADEEVEITLFDAQGRSVAASGRHIAQLASESFQGQGSHVVAWNPGALAPGVYLARLSTSSQQSATVKLTVAR